MNKFAILLLFALTLHAKDSIPSIISSADKTVELMTLPIKIDHSECFPQELIKVRKLSGKIIIDDVLLYENRKPWASSGLIEYRENEKIGYINNEGVIIIPPKFNYGRPFIDGIAAVIVGKHHGYIRSNGEWLVKPTLDWAYDFEGGFASASENGLFGILNSKGEWHIKPQFIQLDPLAGGLLAVRKNGERGFYNPIKGEFIKDGDLGKSYQSPKVISE